MVDCIFCKIIREEIPCHKVYESDEILAFLDINPVNNGHTLVIPKKHYENFHDVPDEVLCKMMRTAKKIAPAIFESANAQAYNIMLSNGKIAGQEIPHAHFHIIPRFKGDKFEVHFNSKKYAENEAEKITEKIKKNL